MKRREFIALAGCAAVMGPQVARAQKSDRTRRIGVLMGSAENDPQTDQYLKALQEALRALGWVNGQNVRIDSRASNDVSGLLSHAAELISLVPDVIVASPTPATNAVQQVARGVPIVFITVSDPIGAGFVESFGRSGGNITGFTNFEATMGGKWLELVSEIAPSVKRVAMLF